MPAAAITPACLMPPPSIFLHLLAFASNAFGSKSTDPAGLPNPLDRQIETVSAQLARSFSLQSNFVIALKKRAPSKCVERLCFSASFFAAVILSKFIAFPHTVFSMQTNLEIGQCESSGFTALEIFSGIISLSFPVSIGAIATPPKTEAPAASSMKI